MWDAIEEIFGENLWSNFGRRIFEPGTLEQR